MTYVLVWDALCTFVYNLYHCIMVIITHFLLLKYILCIIFITVYVYKYNIILFLLYFHSNSTFLHESLL